MGVFNPQLNGKEQRKMRKFNFLTLEYEILLIL